MADRDLTINLKIDRSEAQRQSQQFHAQERGAIAETTRAQRDASGRMRDEHGRFTSEGAAGFRSMATSARASFLDIGAAVGVASLAIRGLKDLLDGVRDAADRAGQKSRELSQGFSSQREQLAELASLKGQTADTRFTLDFAAFNRRTGLTAAESVGAQTAFMNTAAQYIGQGPGKIDQGQADQLMEQASKLALARQIDPRTVLELAGRQLGQRDYSRFGAQAPQTALADLNQQLAVLSSGSGENAQLVRETAKLSASSLSEDALRGVFTSGTDVASMISVLTEGFPEGQAEAGGAALRGIRGFDKRQGAFLRGAGVTPETDVFTALERIRTAAEAEATAGPAGTKVQDILKKHFEDELSARALSVLVNRGVSGGLFGARADVAGANQGPGPALEQIAGYQASERGQQRLAEADVASANLETAAQNSRLTILRTQAIASLRRQGGIDTTETNINDYLNQKVPFLNIGADSQKRIDTEVQNMLSARTPAGMTTGRAGDLFNLTPTAREAELRRRIDELGAAGVNPLAAVGGEDLEVRRRRDEGWLGFAANSLFGTGQEGGISAGPARPAMGAQGGDHGPRIVELLQKQNQLLEQGLPGGRRQPPVLQARPQAPPARLPGNG